VSARLCEICGARVRNLNPRVTTCGQICTEAKRKGRTRKHQMRLEANKVEHIQDWPRDIDGNYLP
jgi:hypothetical protein